jgi:hypothetical protein
MHAVGDLQNNLDRLRSELRKARYEGDLQLDALARGDPSGFLPLLHFTLLHYSRCVARWLTDLGHELYAKNDARFVETVYRLARQDLNYHHSLTCKQFLSAGFAERKVLFVIDLLQLCRNKHAELGRTREAQKAASAACQAAEAAVSAPRAAQPKPQPKPVPQEARRWTEAEIPRPYAAPPPAKATSAARQFLRSGNGMPCAADAVPTAASMPPGAGYSCASAQAELQREGSAAPRADPAANGRAPERILHARTVRPSRAQATPCARSRNSPALACAGARGRAGRTEV